MKKHKGFSLIELLIVVAIILIIAAIAIPNLLKARISANESSAVGSVRTLNTANVQYAAQCPTNGFPAGLVAIGPGVGDCTAAGIIDAVLVTGTKSGYTMTDVGGSPINGVNTTYLVTATPLTVGTTGQRMFCSIQDNVIHYNGTGAGCSALAVGGDPALQ